MIDIEYLLALDEIRPLKSRHNRACDTKDWTHYRAAVARNCQILSCGFTRGLCHE
jgi:hypothetical protein